MQKVRIVTALGDIVVRLDDKKAPLTCEHFLRYVREEYYDGAYFYRAAVSDKNQPYNQYQIDLIEAGYASDCYSEFLRGNLAPEPPLDISRCRSGPYAQIMVETTEETGLKHDDGVISMVRTTSSSVDDNFFICLGEQPELNCGGRRNADGYGFPAFGCVIEGMEIVRAIHKQSLDGQRLTEDVPIFSIRIEP